MANFNLNKVILSGRLAADPELKTTPSGVHNTSFTVAVKRRYSSKNEGEAPTDFIDLYAVYGKRKYGSGFRGYHRRRRASVLRGGI